MGRKFSNLTDQMSDIYPSLKIRKNDATIRPSRTKNMGTFRLSIICKNKSPHSTDDRICYFDENALCGGGAFLCATCAQYSFAWRIYEYERYYNCILVSNTFFSYCIFIPEKLFLRKPNAFFCGKPTENLLIQKRKNIFCRKRTVNRVRKYQN